MKWGTKLDIAFIGLSWIMFSYILFFSTDFFHLAGADLLWIVATILYLFGKFNGH